MKAGRILPRGSGTNAAEDSDGIFANTEAIGATIVSNFVTFRIGTYALHTGRVITWVVVLLDGSVWIVARCFDSEDEVCENGEGIEATLDEDGTKISQEDTRG